MMQKLIKQVPNLEKVRIIKLFDIFGQQVSLNINRERYYKTVIGGLSSVFVIFVLVTIFQSNIFEKVQFSRETQFSASPGLIIMNTSNYMAAFSIEQSDYIENPLFNISVEQRLYYRDIAGNQQKQSMTLELEHCTLDHFSILLKESSKNFTQEYETLNLKKWLCPKLCDSLGSLHSTEAVYSMTQEQKDKVAGIVTIVGPLLGATKTFKPQVGGDDSFMFHILILDAGINWYAQKKMARTSPSIVDLYPKDTFIRLRGEPWMQEILDRMDWDQEYISSGKQPTRPNPLPWFPTPGEICGADFADRSNQCQLLMHDMSEHFLKVVDKLYYSSEESTADAVRENINTEAADLILDFIDETRRDKANNLEHPGVPMIVVYAAHQLTPFQFEYKKQPKPIVDSSDDFYYPDTITKAVGDSTVLASSSMTPGIKWIYDHQHGLTQFPTKLVEYCSQYNGDAVSSIYDSKDAQGQRQFTESGYLGLTCSCKFGKQNIDHCGHACMIQDTLFVEFAADILQSHWKSTISQTSATEAELQNIQKGCTNLH